MRSESNTAPVDTGGEAGAYEAPAIVVLGTFAELTQQGTGPADELLNDGSQI
jgi:hypothetical protein